VKVDREDKVDSSPVKVMLASPSDLFSSSASASSPRCWPFLVDFIGMSNPVLLSFTLEDVVVLCILYI